jgi:hypothetical protein
MSDFPTVADLMFSLMRGLWGEVHPQLRAASIEADIPDKVVRVRFEYDGAPSPKVQESCERAGTECISDFPAPWDLDEQHVSRPMSEKCQPLSNLVYKRYEGWPDA